MAERELQPLPAGYREALERCSFLTPNLAHTLGWAYTENEEDAILLKGASPLRRPGETQPWRWECTITHPDAVAILCEIHEARHG